MAVQNTRQFKPSEKSVGTHYQGRHRTQDVSNGFGKVPSGSNGKVVSEEQIAVLAYGLWISRGRPYGSDQEDWFEAERRLRDGKNGRV